MTIFQEGKEHFLSVLPADSLRGRFARGAIWAVIGAVVSQGSILAASVITARFLGREGFGEYGMIQSTVGTFGILAGMGLGLTATKYVAELRVTNPERAGRIIALSTCVALGTATLASLVLFATSQWLATDILNAPHLSRELRVATGLLFVNALNGTQTGVLAGLEAFRTIARVNLIRGVLTLPLALGGVVLWSLRGAVVALIVTGAVGWTLNHMAIHAECDRKLVPVRWHGVWADRAILWQFSLPAFLGGAMTTPAMWAASSILVNQPHGYSEMGLFSAANQWRAAVAFLPSLFSQPLLSILSNVGVGKSDSFRKLLRANLLLSCGASVLIAGPLVFFSSWIMKAYGSDFLVGRPVFILLILATVISSTAAVIGQAIASMERMWWAFILNSIWALVLLTGAALLVPRYGALGLAGAFLASYSVHAFTVGAYAHVHFRSRVARPTDPVRA